MTRKFKKIAAFTASLLALNCIIHISAFAEEGGTYFPGGGYCPPDVPIAEPDVFEYVDEETEEKLVSMRNELIENVYAKYLDAKVHNVCKSNIVGDVYVGYTSDNQAELDEAKAYCEANGFDMNLMQFFLYDESKIVEESEIITTTQAHIPDGIATEPTTVTTIEATTIIDAGLNEICINLKEFASDKNAVFVSEGFVIFGSEYQQEIDNAKVYCEENGIDSGCVYFILIEPEVIPVVKIGFTNKNNAIFGDADSSGKVDINDAVKIMSYVSNPEKYALDETGLTLADVYNTGDGLNNMDALEIQKYLANII